MISTEYFVVLWLLPVTIFIIIPLSICCCWLAVRAVKDLAGGRVPFIDYFSARYYSAQEGVYSGKSDNVDDQKRKETRIPLEKRIFAEISDGVSSFTGMVVNISRMGLCIRDLPDDLILTQKPISVCIREQENELQLLGRTRWQYKQIPTGKIAGLEITESPSGWNDFVFAH